MFTTAIIGALAAAGLQAGAALSPLDVFGVWRTQSGEVSVLIAPDDKGGPCGRVVKSEEGRPTLGAPFLFGFEKGEEGWRAGKVRDRRSGRTYRAILSRSGPETLELEGCFGPFCRAQSWRREADGVEGVEPPKACTPPA
jgi:uncharacterized protein (DUF2147 family)